MTKSKQTMQYLCANQYGIKYAKEVFAYHKELGTKDLYELLPRIMKMCAACYRIDTSDDTEENVEEAVKQASVTWEYLCEKSKKIK